MFFSRIPLAALRSRPLAKELAVSARSFSSLFDVEKMLEHVAATKDIEGKEEGILSARKLAKSAVANVRDLEYDFEADRLEARNDVMLNLLWEGLFGNDENLVRSSKVELDGKVFTLETRKTVTKDDAPEPASIYVTTINFDGAVIAYVGNALALDNESDRVIHHLTLDVMKSGLINKSLVFALSLLEADAVFKSEGIEPKYQRISCESLFGKSALSGITGKKEKPGATFSRIVADAEKFCDEHKVKYIPAISIFNPEIIRLAEESEIAKSGLV